jgi:cytochrome b561
LFYAKYGPWTSLGVVAGLLLLLLVAFRLVWGLGAWLLAPFAGWRRGKG